MRGENTAMQLTIVRAERQLHMGGGKQHAGIYDPHRCRSEPVSDFGMHEDGVERHDVAARDLVLQIQNPAPLFREAGLFATASKLD